MLVVSAVALLVAGCGTSQAVSEYPPSPPNTIAVVLNEEDQLAPTRQPLTITPGETAVQTRIVVSGNHGEHLIVSLVCRSRTDNRGALKLPKLILRSQSVGEFGAQDDASLPAGTYEFLVNGNPTKSILVVQPSSAKLSASPS
jgi:hypothetical protein